MNLGVFLGALALLLVWGVWGVTSKLAIQGIGLQIVVWAQIASLAIFPLYFVIFQDLLPLKIESVAVAWALVSGVLGVGGSIILYLLLRAAPSSIAIPLSALYPVVTVLLSVFILREQITAQQWLGVVFALVAIALLTIDFRQLIPRPQ